MEHVINHANRKFYEIPSETAEDTGIEERTNLPLDHKGLLSLVCQSVIGKDKTFSGPPRLLVAYAMDLLLSLITVCQMLNP